MDTISIILSVASLTTIWLSFFIARSEKQNSNEIFSLYAFSVSLWVFGLLMFRVTQSLDAALNYSRFYYVAAAAIPAFFLHFTCLFPQKNKPAVFKVVMMYAPLVAIALALSIDPHFVLKEVYFLNDGVKSALISSLGYVLYAIYFVTFIVLAYINLLRSFFASKDSMIRAQVKFILIGTIVPHLIGMFFDLIYPPFDYTLVWIGPIAVIGVIWSVLHAVYRYRLLNAKVIVGELLISSLWVFILIQVLISKSDQDLYVNLGLLILTILVGILLIRSIKKEIFQREKIEKLATDLETANVRLTELDRQKSEFVSFATHQLRAPLTAMKGYASMILEGDMGKITEETKSAVSRIFDSSKTLAHIVDDYLNITRIELGTMKYAFETIDLRAMVEEVIAELGPNLKKDGLTFEFTADEVEEPWDWRTTADPDKLKQVIANLVDNSIKYTPKGYVHVTLFFDKTRHKFIFRVEDNGIGIAPETLPLLFNKFSRAGNANKANIKGTGLGLYVAKQIVEAHHGKIYAASAGEGKGSTFIVELEPFAKA
jgi:signal transduction histidine kinase